MVGQSMVARDSGLHARVYADLQLSLFAASMTDLSVLVGGPCDGGLLRILIDSDMSSWRRPS